MVVYNFTHPVGYVTYPRIPRGFSTDEALDLSGAFMVHLYKDDIAIVGGFSSEHQLNINSVSELSEQVKLNLKTDTAILLNQLDLEKVQGMRIYYNRDGFIMGYGLNSVDFEHAVYRQDLVVDNIHTFAETFKHNSRGSIIYSVCGKLFSANYTYPLQIWALYMLAELTVNSFVREDNFKIGSDPTAVGLEFAVECLLEYFLEIELTQKELDTIGNVVSNVLRANLIKEFLLPDFEEVEKTISFARELTHKRSTKLVAWAGYKANTQYYNMAFDLIQVSVPEQLNLGGITVPKEVVIDFQIRPKEKSAILVISHDYIPQSKAAMIKYFMDTFQMSLDIETVKE